jgi:hypothetical protein
MKLDQQTNPHQQHGDRNKKVNVADNCLCGTDELHLALTILVFARGEYPNTKNCGDEKDDIPFCRDSRF